MAAETPALVNAGAAADWQDLGSGVRHRDVLADAQGGRQRLRVWSFDPALWRMRIAPAPPQGFSVQEIAPGTGLAINGGYFRFGKGAGSRRLEPTGLVIANGRRLHRQGGGSAVIFDTGRTIGISWAKERSAWQNARAALQAGPFIVDPGGRIGINRKRGPRARRSAVCLRPSGEVLVVAVTGGISLHELARTLAAPPPGGYGCERAINLDGGTSTQVFARFGNRIFDVPGLTGVVNAVIFEPRH